MLLEFACDVLIIATVDPLTRVLEKHAAQVVNEVHTLLPRVARQLLVQSNLVFINSRYVLSQVRIKMVFDLVVSAPVDYLGDFGPLISYDFVRLDELELLLLGPLFLG